MKEKVGLISKRQVARAERRDRQARRSARREHDVIMQTPTGTTVVIEAKTLRWAAQLSPMSVIDQSKHGIRASVVKHIQKEAGFSSADFAEYLQINSRTLQRYLQKNTLMSPEVSERALLVAQIVELGKEAFGDEELFKIWLVAPSRALGGIKPESLLGSATGMQLIRAELNRIEHGVY